MRFLNTKIPFHKILTHAYVSLTRISGRDRVFIGRGAINNDVIKRFFSTYISADWYFCFGIQFDLYALYNGQFERVRQVKPRK